jgi:FkbM family methyltransferase
MLYANDVVLVQDEVDGIAPWGWTNAGLKSFSFIKQDWDTSHKEKFLKYVKNKKVCVQAGGFMGMYPRLFADHFERVYTFEPDPLNFYCLTFNCQSNNIIKMQAALGHEHKLITVNRRDAENPGTNTINENYGLVPMITLDSLNLDGCDLMQLDVEFYELNVLRGALDTIREYKPVITCELGFLSWFDLVQEPGSHHNGTILEGNTLEVDILDILGPLGYKKVDHSVSDGIFAVD